MVAASSEYCQVLCLLLELARYSLEELDRVHEEAACTSISRKWAVPGKIWIDFLITQTNRPWLNNINNKMLQLYFSVAVPKVRKVFSKNL